MSRDSNDLWTQTEYDDGTREVVYHKSVNERIEMAIKRLEHERRFVFTAPQVELRRAA